MDVRRGSLTFGNSVGVLLDDVAHHQLWVPPGFAHGFLVLSEVADFCYLCSEYYHPQSEQGIAWNDPALGIRWPALAENTAIQLSAKDQGNPRLAEQDEGLKEFRKINTYLQAINLPRLFLRNRALPRKINMAIMIFFFPFIYHKS